MSTQVQSVVSAGWCTRMVSTLLRPRRQGSSQLTVHESPTGYWCCEGSVLSRRERTGDDTSRARWLHQQTVPWSSTSSHCALVSRQAAEYDALVVNDTDRRRLAPTNTQCYKTTDEIKSHDGVTGSGLYIIYQTSGRHSIEVQTRSPSICLYTLWSCDSDPWPSDLILLDGRGVWLSSAWVMIESLHTSISLR